MKKLKELMLGTSFMWLPILGCILGEIITKFI